MATLYRGQPISGPSSRTATSILEQLYGKSSLNVGGTGLQGQWYTTDPARARNYMPSSFEKHSWFDPKAGPKHKTFGYPMGEYDKAKSITTKPGLIKSMDLSPKDFEKVKSFTKKVPNLSGYGFATNLPNEFLVPKTFIQNRNPSINLGQTLRAYGNRGLGFLKQNAFRTLAMLGSLPAQAGIMTLSPTRMGNAELPQMPQGSPTQINQGGGNGGGQPHTGGGGYERGNYGGRGHHWADGGLINLYRYGGFI